MTYRRVVQADAYFELFGCAVKRKRRILWTRHLEKDKRAGNRRRLEKETLGR